MRVIRFVPAKRRSSAVRPATQQQEMKNEDSDDKTTGFTGAALPHAR